MQPQHRLKSRADFIAHTAAILAEPDAQAREEKLLLGLLSAYRASLIGDWPNGSARLIMLCATGERYAENRNARKLDRLCSRESYKLAGETALWFLYDREQQVREGALQLLGLLGDILTIRPLLRLLHVDDTPHDAEQIRDSIEEIENSENNTQGTYGFLDSTDDLLTLLRDPNHIRASQIIPVLALRHDDPRVVPVLLATYEAEPMLRSDVVYALCNIPRDTQTILPHLLRWYHTAETDRHRSGFLFALAVHGDERVLPILLNPPEPETKSIDHRIFTLGRLADPRSGPLLAQYVETAREQTLDHAIHALVALKNTQYLGLIRQRMLDAPATVAWALGVIGGDLARETLLNMCYRDWPDEQRPRHQPLQIQRAVIDALGSLRDPVVIPHLEPLLYDSSWTLALGAAKALQAIDTPEARTAVERWNQAS